MSQHFYDKNGEPRHFTEDAKGNLRASTLRDCKKHGWLVGVTTIIGIVEKPMIKKWLIDQHIKASWELFKQGKVGEDYEVYKKDCQELANKTSEEAKDKGTFVHDLIEQMFKTGNRDLLKDYKNILKTIDELEAQYGNLISEQVVLTDKYAGKCDAHNSKVVVDFKTQKTKGKEFAKYDEWKSQLAAYGQAVGDFDKKDYYSLVISSDEDDKCQLFKYELQDIEKHREIFNLMVDLFYKIKM